MAYVTKFTENGKAVQFCRRLSNIGDLSNVNYQAVRPTIENFKLHLMEHLNNLTETIAAFKEMVK